jgi:hypothetical protein
MNIRLCYASTRQGLESDLIEDLSEILTTARNFNADHQIFGVLYYANRYYFQCLEGEQYLIEELFERIKNDHRHTMVIHLGSSQIVDLGFKKWSMKYVQKSSGIDHFFRDLGYAAFYPASLDPNNLSAFIDLLIAENSAKVKKKVGLKYRGVNPYL